MTMLTTVYTVKAKVIQHTATVYKFAFKFSSSILSHLTR